MAVNLTGSRITAKDFTPDDPQAIIAEKDPLDLISLQMADRGFDTLWTVRPTTPGKKVRFNDDVKKEFLRMYAVTGRIAFSAVAVGVSTNSIDNHRDADPIFAQAVLEAERYFQDVLHAEMHRRGVEGFDQEVLGGRNKDQIIKVKVYSDRMLELLARQHMPGLKKGSDKTEVIEQTNVVNNQFNFANLSDDDLATVKKLLENQALPIDGTVIDES